jgi:RNA polymerase sigma-70 factor, ECF subfamily
MDDPDLALIEDTGRGNPGAFEALVGRYQGPLVNFIARLIRDRYLAEDLTQEVFLRVYRAAPRFQARAKVSTWIFQIAYNLALTEIGRSRRQQRLREALSLEREQTAKEPYTGPAAHWEAEEEVVVALALLPENQKAALLLRTHEGLSYREIADILGVSVSGVESLLFRARTTLKRDLARK